MSNWAEFLTTTLEWVRESGWVGWLGFIVVYSFTCVVFLPGSVLTVGAGAIYGFWGGTLLVTISSAAGAAVNFLTSRYLLRNYLQRKFAKSRKLLALEAAVGKDGWKAILLSRISPVVPHSIVSYASGLTQISFIRYTLSSLVGFIPISAAYSYAGALVGRVARTSANQSNNDPIIWAFYGVGAIVTIVVAIMSTHAAHKALRKCGLEDEEFKIPRKDKAKQQKAEKVFRQN